MDRDPIFTDHFRQILRKRLGLGLFIAREIAKAHGGDIAVAGAEDDVTVFEVSLPRHARVRETTGV